MSSTACGWYKSLRLNCKAAPWKQDLAAKLEKSKGMTCSTQRGVGWGGREADPVTGGSVRSSVQQPNQALQVASLSSHMQGSPTHLQHTHTHCLSHTLTNYLQLLASYFGNDTVRQPIVFQALQAAVLLAGLQQHYSRALLYSFLTATASST